MYIYIYICSYMCVNVLVVAMLYGLCCMYVCLLQCGITALLSTYQNICRISCHKKTFTSNIIIVIYEKCQVFSLLYHLLTLLNGLST